MTLAPIRKLENFARLSSGERRELERLLSKRVGFMKPLEDLNREGDSPRSIFAVLDGWACRYKVLQDGRRQIVSFFLPGDLCASHIYILREMDHSIGTLGPATVAEITCDGFEAVMAGSLRIGHALWWESLVTAAIQREWTVNLGQRDAAERLAHLFCELFIRLRCVGRTDGDTCAMPATQSHLADAIGVTEVHLHRTMKTLRDTGLVVLERRTLKIPDFDALRQYAMFQDKYLHLERDGRHLDASEQ